MFLTYYALIGEKLFSIVSEKKIGTSFRINPDILRKLNAEAKKTETSVNSLLNQICRQHVEWHSAAADAGICTIFKPMLKNLLDVVDDIHIRNIAKKIAKDEGQDFIMLLSREYDVDTALKLIETWLKVIKYPYSYEQNGSEHRFHIHHDMGKKYSVYLSSLYENVLNEFEITKPDFKITDSSITFVVDTEKPDSPLESIIDLKKNNNSELIKCHDCGCFPEECEKSRSPKECPNCTCDECCCWQTIHA